MSNKIARGKMGTISRFFGLRMSSVASDFVFETDSFYSGVVGAEKG
jgi:hypothetical protein